MSVLPPLIGLDVEDWLNIVEMLEEWIRGPVREEKTGHLERYALRMRDEVRQEYARVAAEAYAAKLVAEQGPPSEAAQESSLTREQSEELARMMNRADAFVQARTVLEDLPLEGAPIEKWTIVDALAEAADTASEEG